MGSLNERDANRSQSVLSQHSHKNPSEKSLKTLHQNAQSNPYIPSTNQAELEHKRESLVGGQGMRRASSINFIDNGLYISPSNMNIQFRQP